MSPALKWLKSLGTSPVLVVGNGTLPEWLPQREGDFRTVIRINNFVLGGDAGERVTHWCCNGYKDIEPRDFQVAFCPWTPKLSAALYHKAFLEKWGEGHELVCAENNRHIMTHFPKYSSDYKQFPSTGFCLLSYLHRHGIRAYCAGFDFFKTGHYWDPNHRHDHKRTRRLEEKFVKTRRLALDLTPPPLTPKITP